MELWFDGNIINSEDLGFEKLYRAFFFGDGLFESIYADNKYVYFLNEHLDRINVGLNTLGIESSYTSDFESILSGISKLISRKNTEHSRVKIAVWRKGKGTYYPQSKDSHCIILCEDANPFDIEKIDRIKISNQVKLVNTKTSEFKTLSALSYVLAANERAEKNVDELLLVDENDNILETVSSSLIVVNGKVVKIPKARSGQVNGIVSNYLIDSMLFEGFEIIETDIKYSEVQNSDLSIICNSFIIKVLYRDNNKLLDALNNQITNFPKLQLLL